VVWLLLVSASVATRLPDGSGTGCHGTRQRRQSREMYSLWAQWEGRGGRNTANNLLDSRSPRLTASGRRLIVPVVAAQSRWQPHPISVVNRFSLSPGDTHDRSLGAADGKVGEAQNKAAMSLRDNGGSARTQVGCCKGFRCGTTHQAPAGHSAFPAGRAPSVLKVCPQGASRVASVEGAAAEAGRVSRRRRG
jgi:hypothetical protein